MNAKPHDVATIEEFAGSQFDPAEAVDTHLFVMSPNNSGSTFVRRALETCREVWRLPREGQHVLGYTGPDLLTDQKELIWAASKDYLDWMRDPALYDWPRTRKGWYFQSKAHKPDASVFLTKAPPFLAIIDQMSDAFENTRLIFLVRNPYAVVEAICRRIKRQFPVRNDALLIASRHIMHCFEVQKDNLAKHSDRSVFFTYEQLCEAPREAADLVKQLVPQLEDLDFDQKLAVKGMYNERLRNMNADQIGRLSRDDIVTINAEFSKHEPLLQAFGYELLDPGAGR